MKSKAAVPVLFGFVISVAWSLCACSAAASTEKVLYSFQGVLQHGVDPMSPLISDASGNLYGTTNVGGDLSRGTVYKLTPNSKGGWSQTVLYSFKGGSDGWSPYSGLVLDALGSLYGTTGYGGTGSCNCGTVFKLAPNSSGGWMESILYSFKGGSDGQGPYASPVFDSAGNLYGTTAGGGTGLYGTVFQLTPTSGGGWTESVLHSFTNRSDGGSPRASLVFDTAGNLYGTAEYGGSSGNGLVFELTSNSPGVWAETVLYNFAGGTDGATPSAPLIFDTAGNLYSTTSRGGGFYGGAGTVFELKANGNGSWTESVLYSFGMTNGDGLYPDGVVFDNAGNLYGTTGFGGNTGCYSNTGCGVVFELVPGSGGQWTERILHTFSGGADGGIPYAGLIFDQGGNLYGTTGYGGSANLGAVFKLSLSGSSHWQQRTIYWFPGADGTNPSSNLISDNAGNLYGTTPHGGFYQNGSVFKLTPTSHGGWKRTLIYNFKGGTDGSGPIGGVVFDSAGNLYGTTSGGGTGVCYFGGCGTVFKLTPSSNGKWAESVLYSFQGGADGEYPYAGVTFSQGNLFGTTFAGGGNSTGCMYFGCGVVYELTPSSGGQWTEKVIYTFTGAADNGQPYYGSLAVDPAGSLYGTTSYYGCDGCSGYFSTVYQLSPNGSGGWTQSVIYTFTDYSIPFAGVTFDHAGNLYGTTVTSLYNNPNGAGTVFELRPSSGGWTRDILYSFTGKTDGGGPYAGVTFDAVGNLYGTTYEGGNPACLINVYSTCGVVFKLASGSNGSWTYSVLHAFNGSPGDGSQPTAGVILDAAGNLYGTSSTGGATGYGTVFEVTP
jgi:uncharacterized repeat protein (TIGR03803 family)